MVLCAELVSSSFVLMADKKRIMSSIKQFNTMWRWYEHYALSLSLQCSSLRLHSKAHSVRKGVAHGSCRVILSLKKARSSKGKKECCCRKSTIVDEGWNVLVGGSHPWKHVQICRSAKCVGQIGPPGEKTWWA